VVAPTARTALLSDLTNRLECGRAAGRETQALIARPCSQWDSLQSLLLAAEAGLAEAEQGGEGQAPPRSAAERKQHKPSRVAGAAMAALEVACRPAAATLASFYADSRLERMQNASAPSLAGKAARCAGALALSCALVALGTWILREFMTAAALVVCSAVDGLLAVAGRGEGVGGCVPMVPEGWMLPVSFGLLAAYIAAQCALIWGITVRHTLLHLDRYALRALALWWVIAVAYATFVYISRFVISVVMAFGAEGAAGAAGGAMARRRPPAGGGDPRR
jgi:hypothetical protein